MMCHFLGHPHDPEMAFEEIKRHHISIYYFDNLSDLASDLSTLTGQNIAFDRVINKSRPMDIDFDQHMDHIEEIVSKDMKLFLLCKNFSQERLTAFPTA